MPEQPFCCRAHREAHQLRGVHDDLSVPLAARMQAALLLDHLTAIGNGRYGGVDIEQLFD